MFGLALKVIEGSIKGEEFIFEETGLCLIGRDQSCSISIPREKDVGISRRHCLLIIKENDIRIRDLYSTNGTYVNGHRLIPSPIGDNPEADDPNDRFLADGDKISISNIKIKVHIKSEIESVIETTSLPLEDPIPTTNTTKTRLIQFARGRTRNDSLIPEPNNVNNKILPLEAPLEDTHLFLSLPITEPIPRPKLWGEANENPTDVNINKTPEKAESTNNTTEKKQPLKSKEDKNMIEKPDLSIITGNPSLENSEENTSDAIEENNTREKIETKEETTLPIEEDISEKENVLASSSTEEKQEEKKETEQEERNKTVKEEPEGSGEEDKETAPTSTETDSDKNCVQDISAPPCDTKAPEPDNKKKQLFDTKKMMALEELAGTLAYDFNEQFNEIMKQSELLKEEQDPEKIKECAENISRIAELSMDMTDQLLMFAYHDNAPSVAKVNLVEVVTEIASVMKHTAGRKIEIKYAQAHQPNTLFTRGVQLEIYEALLNIAFNALESITAPGTITFRINQVVLIDEDISNLSFTVEPGSFIKIMIEDTGCGIKDEDLSRIFDPFFTTKSNEEALGMGLTVAYGIIKSHKGVINVKNTSDEGSCFEIYLPLSENT